MASSRVGGIDDPIWSTGISEASRRRMGTWRFIASLVAVPGLPGLAVLVHGFDWVSLVAGIVAGTILLALVHRRIAGPAIFGVLLLVPSFAALEAVNLLGFHTLSLDGPPPRLHWCGRDYVLGTRSWPSPATPEGSNGERVVLFAPSGAAIYSDRGCTPQRVSVPTLLFTPTGASTWLAYGLEGGP